MTQQNAKLKVYTVVEVWRGIAAGAKIFRKLGDAQKYAQRLRRGRDLQQDDVQVFENTILI